MGHADLFIGLLTWRTVSSLCSPPASLAALFGRDFSLMTSWAPVWSALAAGRLPVPSPALQSDELALLVGPPLTFWLCVWCALRLLGI